MTTDRTLQNLQRRLERWELKHLRKLAAELNERLERAEEELQRARAEADRAWGCAEGWQRDAMDLQEELWNEGRAVGLTQDGAIVVLPTGMSEPAPAKSTDLLTCIGRQGGRRVMVIGRYTAWGQVYGLREDLYGERGTASQRDVGCLDAPLTTAGGSVEIDDGGPTGDRFVTEHTAYRSAA